MFHCIFERREPSCCRLKKHMTWHNGTWCNDVMRFALGYDIDWTSVIIAAHARRQGRITSPLFIRFEPCAFKANSFRRGGWRKERQRKNERKNGRKSSALRNSVLEIAGVRSRSASLLHAHAEIWGLDKCRAPRDNEGVATATRRGRPWHCSK